MSISVVGDEVLLAVEARSALAVYIPSVHKTDTGAAAIPPRHLMESVLPAIQDDALGHTLIIAPPSSAKTVTMIAAASWWLGQDPSQHVAYICNTDRRAYERSVAIRDVIEHDEQYLSIFPEALPDKSKGWAEYGWFLKRPDIADKDPSMLAAGVGASILGARIKRGVLDDIADMDNMATPLQREKVILWLSKTFMTRIMPGGRVVMICTRWHEEDPAAWAIDQGWHVVHIPGLVDAESYWPELWPTEALACANDVHPEGMTCCKKRELGSLAFGQQYMGVVISDESAKFKRAWWRRYQTLPAGLHLGGIFVDMAHEEKTTADYSVIATWRTNGHAFYLTDLIRERMEFPELERAVRDAQIDHKLPVYIEDTPGSKPLIQTLQRDLQGVIGRKVRGVSKLARAEAVLPLVEAGNCYLPEDAPWVGEFIEEHARFPLGAHDDMVDTTSMALRQLSAGGVVDPGKFKPYKGREYEKVSA